MKGMMLMWLVETRWGLGLDARYFPDQNVVMFSKVHPHQIYIKLDKCLI